jgi:hypothetical protein
MNRKLSTWRVLTPLGIIGAFISLTEAVAGIAVSKTTGYVQGGLTVFVCVFPVIVFAGFFLILWAKSHVFYPPADFGSKQDVKAYVDAMRGTADPTLPGIEIEQGKAEGELVEPAEPAIEELPAKPNMKASAESDAGKKEPTTPDELEMAMFFAFFENRPEMANVCFRR